MGHKCFISKQNSILLFNIEESPLIEDELDFQFEEPILSMKMELKNSISAHEEERRC